MPVLIVEREKLFALLGQSYEYKDFETLSFEFGVELEGETSEKKIIEKEKGVGCKEAQNASDIPLYKIDIPANRYDLLCIEGLARALAIFTRKQAVPEFRLTAPQHKIVVQAQTAQIRPFIVSAVLRNVTFTPDNFTSFMGLQDKLHQNICRKRTLVAIGTHDLDTLQGPFTYEALSPEDIRFVPLKELGGSEVSAAELMQYLDQHKENRLSSYTHIVKNSPVYPVIYDANRVVLSLPPIINGEHSKITLATKNVFVECTATDLTKAHTVLNTMVAMFSQYCSDPFTVEAVEIVYPDGRTEVTPTIEHRLLEVKLDYINSHLGLQLTGAQTAALLNRMQLSTSVQDGANTLQIAVPITRSDVIHACDVVEDVGIAYGYNNLQWTMPNTNTIGKEEPLNQLTDHLRSELAMYGYTEVLTFALCGRDESFAFLNKANDGRTAVEVMNPQTPEFQVVRSSLLPGLLKTLHHNVKIGLPLRLFEVSDVAVQCEGSDVGARNNRQLAALYCNTTSGLEYIHGLLDRVMQVLRVPLNPETGYSIQPSDDATYFPGRQATVLYRGVKIGQFGVLHPDVLNQEPFRVKYPCSFLEIDVEPFL